MPLRMAGDAGPGPREHRARLGRFLARAGLSPFAAHARLGRFAAGALGVALLVSACSGSAGTTHGSAVTDGPLRAGSITASTTGATVATSNPAGASTPTTGTRPTASGAAPTSGAPPATTTAAAPAPSTSGRSKPTTATSVRTTSPSVTHPAPGAAAPDHQPRCQSSVLAITAQRGSGAMQEQYATIQFANRAGPGCWLVGHATATLMAHGHPVGHPVTAAHAGTPALYLAAGQAASAVLHGPSTCNAGVSDQVRISAPGQAAHTDVALPMRACALVVDAFRRT